MQFINPAMLAGTLLFAVPLIIHLLNRQRYKRRRWAAMEYLLIAFKKQRRRLRIENLLLLLLRCLIPIILALAIARPVLREGGPIGGLGTSVHYFVVLDASYSMGYEPEGALSPFQRGRRIIDTLLQRLDDRASASKITLMIAGTRPTVPVNGDLEVSRARDIVAGLTDPDDSAGDLGEALEQVVDLVLDATDNDKRVYLLTDMQVRAFGADPATAAGTAPGARPDPDTQEALDTARDALDQLGEIAQVHLIDVGPTASTGAGGPEDNLQITDLRTERAAAVTRVAVPIIATVVNRTSTNRTAQVTLEIDGTQPLTELLELPAGGEGEAVFDVTFRETGKRMLRASLQGDGLAADDERFLVLDARERIRVLLVDGSAARDIPEDIREASLLRNILDPTGGEGPPELTVFEPKVITQMAMMTGQEDLGSYDLVVLANVDVLNSAAIVAIEDALRGGTGMLVMLGDNTEIVSFNKLNNAGEGPMPMLLTRVASVRRGGSETFNAEIVRPEHPVFTDLLPEVLEAAPIWSFVASDVSALPDDAQVLATLNDPEQSPLLVARQFGNGKALFLTSSTSRRPDSWNQFQDPWVAFPLFHPLAYWLSLPAQDPFNAEVGAVLTCSLDDRPVGVAVVLPERAGQQREPIADERRPLPGGRFGLPPFRRTLRAGFYSYEMTLEKPSGNEEASLPFAVNVDPDEGDLRYFSHDAAVERLGVTRILRGLPSEGGIIIEAGSAELGPPLLMMVLLLVLGEAALARFVTRRRN